MIKQQQEKQTNYSLDDRCLTALSSWQNAKTNEFQNLQHANKTSETFRQPGPCGDELSTPERSQRISLSIKFKPIHDQPLSDIQSHYNW